MIARSACLTLKKPFSIGACLALASGVALLGCSSSPASTGKASLSPISVGLITENTGASAGSRETEPQAIQDRIKWQNDHGGVDGHPITITSLDDASSPAQNLAAAKALDSDGVVAIMEAVNDIGAGTPYLESRGIPVVESTTDVPCGTDRSLFCTTGSLSPNNPPPTATTYGLFFKSQGVTNVAGIGYGNIPSSVQDAEGFTNSAKLAGLNEAYLGTQNQIGQADWGPECQAMKAAHVDGIGFAVIGKDEVAALTACKQIGLTFKVAISTFGYGPTFLGNTLANTEAQGLDFGTPWVPSLIKTPATTEMVDAFNKYGGVGYPGVQEEEGWAVGDLLIYGMEHAGSKITRGSIIHALQDTTDYTAGGLEITPVNFKKYFGQGIINMSPAPGYCMYFVKLAGQQYSLINQRPTCGKVVG